jgi:MFS family permease
MQWVSTNAREDAKIGRSTWLALAAMALGVFVIANDFTALSVAIPRIEAQLHTSLNTAQWVINGYALVFGVVIVTGGRLADLFGRKRAFMAGASVFGFFSLLSGLMPNVYLLIICRALMGVGGAVMWPAVLGLTYTILPASRKGLAGGLILGVAGLGNAAGPLLGGWLTDVATWRLVFFINLPITAFTMLVILREVPESAAQGGERGIDYPGIALLSAGTVALLLALDLSPDGGFGRPDIISLFAGGLALLAAFFVTEHRQGSTALVPADMVQQGLLGRVRDGPAHIGDILLRAALPAPVHGEGAQVLGAALGGRPAAADECLRDHVVRGGAAVQPHRPQGRRVGRSRIPGRRHLLALRPEPQLDLRVAGRRHDRAGRGHRPVLLFGHHRRGDRA